MSASSPAASRPAARPATIPLSRGLYRLVGFLGVVGLVGLLLLALFPGAVAPFDPTERVGRPFQPPGAPFLLGTNDIGQDLWSELIWGTRVSLTIGLTVGVLSVVIGTLVGLVSGYFDTLASSLLLRLVDLTLVLPFLPLIILLSAYVGPGTENIILILTLVSWAIPARLVRSRVLQVRAQPYVEAAHALGAGAWRILRVHVWPATRSLVLVQFVLISGTSILAEASLSFLGLGDPSTKSWGTMLYFAQANGVLLGPAWRWWVLPPGLMISLAVLSLVMVSFGLEQRLEPTLRS